MGYHQHTSGVFSKAVAFVEYDHSGNPNEKYKSGSGILSQFNKEASKNGVYESYMDNILKETEHRYRELASEIQELYTATFSKSPELLMAEQRIKKQLLQEMDRGNNPS